MRRPCSSRRLNEATIFRRLIAFCRRCAEQCLARRVGTGLDRLAELALLLVEVDAVDQLLDRVGAGATLEVVAVLVAQLAPQHLVFDDLAREQALELVPRPLDQFELDVVALAQRLDLLVGVTAHLLGVGAFRLGGLGLLLELLEAAVDGELELLADLVALGEVLGLEAGEVFVALLLVDPGDQVGGEVDDLLELLGLELFLRLDAGEEVGQPRAGAAEVPDVDDGSGELDVAHPVAADLRAGDLDAAALADDALEAHPLVLAAVALPVASRSEDLLAEQAVLLRTQRAVVDGLRLLHLAVRPEADVVRGGQPDLELFEHVDVEHVRSCPRVCRRVSRLLLVRSARRRAGDRGRRRRSRAPDGRCRCRVPRRRGRPRRRDHASRSRGRRRRAPRR